MIFASPVRRNVTLLFQSVNDIVNLHWFLGMQCRISQSLLMIEGQSITTRDPENHELL